MRPLGYHISGGQKLGSSLFSAATSGFTAAQIFLGPPQKMELTTVPSYETDIFRDTKEKTGVKVYVHAPYVLHAFAKPENVEKNNRFIKLMMKRAVELGVDGFVLHMGGTKWYDPDLVVNAQNPYVPYVDIAERLLDEIGDSLGQCPILFENCANGNDMSGHLDVIGELIRTLRFRGHNVGLCLDTLHAWAWGYDYRNGELLKATVDSIQGLVQLLHLNSGPEKSGCGSKYDRHEAIYKGCIPQDCFVEILDYFSDIPAIIEGHDYSDILSDCAFVKHVDSKRNVTV